MGWEIGEHNGRDIGYGVPAKCDHPKCDADIDRGLGYVCGSDPYGGDHGCGLFFCGAHTLTVKKDGRYIELCVRCKQRRPPFTPKPDVQEWIDHKATDPSWAEWRSAQREAGGGTG